MTRGYTLMEVVVVVSVLAVVAAVAAPSIGRTADDVKARAEVARVAAFLRSAREQAVTRQQPYEVLLDAQARTLLLRRAGRDADGGAQASRRLSPRLRVEAEPAYAGPVTFLPHGMSSGGGFRIEAPGPRAYVVTVDALTGRVTTRRRAL